MSARPRLLVVTRSTPLHAGSGGMEEVAWDLAVGLSGRWDVRVLTTPVPGRPGAFTHEGVSVQSVDGGRPGRYGPTWWWRTARHPAARGADVVLSVSAGASSLCRATRGPVYVVQAHGTALAEARAVRRGRGRLWTLRTARLLAWSVIDKGTYRRASLVIAASDHVADQLRTARGRSTRTALRLEVVRNGVPVTPVRRGGSAPDRPVVAAVGRLTRQKGVDRAVAALQHLPSPYRLVVLGDGPERAALAAQAHAAGLGSRVELVGHQSRADVARALEAVDVLVFSVREANREGLPLSVLEALAAGARVVVPEQSRWPAALESALSRADVGDPVALAAAIRQAAAAPPSALPEEHDIRWTIEQYDRLLHQALFERGRRLVGGSAEARADELLPH